MLQNNLTNRTRRYFRGAHRQEFGFYSLNKVIDFALSDGAFCQRDADFLAKLDRIEVLPPAVLFDDHQAADLDALVCGEAAAALKTFPAPPDRLTAAQLPAVDNTRIPGLTERALHRGPPAFKRRGRGSTCRKPSGLERTRRSSNRTPAGTIECPRVEDRVVCAFR